MLKKEFNEILKQSLFFIVLAAALPLLVLMISMFLKMSLSYYAVFFPMYQIGLFIFAVLMGVTIFSSEKKQGGIEYILTFPFSRMRLLWMKILPRLVALCILLLLYSLYLTLVTGGGNSADSLLILPLYFLPILIFSVFILSFSLSASHDNIVSLAILVVFIFMIHSLLTPFFPEVTAQFFGRWVKNKSIFFVFSGCSVLISFAVPFFLAFRKFDLHPTKEFNRRYVKVFIPLMVISLLLSAIFVYSLSEPMSRLNLWYLTANHKLIESDLNSTYIYDQDNGKIATLDIPVYNGVMNQLESGGHFYAESYSRIDGRKFNRLNVMNNTVQEIYSPKNNYYNSHCCGGWVFKNTFALFEGNYNQQNMMLVLVNLDNMGINKIKLPAKLQEKYRIMQVIGVDEVDGKRAWLVYGEKGLKLPVFRIWEDGRIQELAIRGRSPFYINNMLISRADDGMAFYRLSAAGCEEIKTDPRGKSVILYPLNCLDLNHAPCKVIYGQFFGRNGKSLMKVDLEKLEVTKLLDFSGTFICYSPEECYLLDNHINPRKVYRVSQDGQLQLLRTFSGFNARAKDNFFQRSRNGIITKENGKISVYVFPDLREITFNGLN